jgi:glycosyltransferase involved in cell wall biosynthesis
MIHSGEQASLKKLIAISNFGDFVGGGECSFFDMVSHIGNWFCPIVVAPKKGRLVNRFKVNNIYVEVIPFLKIRPWLFSDILKSIQSLKKTVEKANASLIYANGSKPAFYGGIVGRILKLPVIWHCRIAERDYLLDSVLSQLSRLIIVNSRATAKRFSKRIQNKIRIVHNGVDIQWLKDKSVCRAHVQATGCRIILVVARVSKVKRHDLAISAFEEAAGTHPDLHLVLVGAKDPFEPEWWNYLQKRANNSLYTERIHWIGQVEDIRPWYRSAAILLLPSDNESFGRVLVEAMAFGIPVIATRCGGVPEIVRHGKDGILVSMGKSHELADAIRIILENDDTRLKMGRFGAERAKEFSLESHIKAIIGAFEEASGLERTIRSKQDSNILIGGGQ